MMNCRVRAWVFAAIPLVLSLAGVWNAGGSLPRGQSTTSRAVMRNLAAAPATFEVNEGQASPDVRLFSRGSGYALLLSSEGATLRLDRASSSNAEPSQPDADVLTMRLHGANPKAMPRPEGELPLRSHYFLGQDPSDWRTGVPHFARARCEQVYPGVDLVYYGNQRELEYDFVVAPGADPGQIRLRFEGANRLELDRAGDLLIHTSGGVVRQRRPLIYQELGGTRTRLAGGYRLARAEAGDLVEFEVSGYDTARPLVIDPVLSYSSYLGGAGDDYANEVAVAPDGTAWVAGHTSSVSFPAADASHRSPGGGMDTFLARVSSSGELLSVTYLGGSGDDRGHSVYVDQAGRPHVVGETGSANFPVVGAVQGTFGGFIDAYVTRLSATGDALLYSTYLGGSGDDRANDVHVDGSGVAFVTGFTTSANFPTTPGALSTSIQSPNADAFVTAVSAAGNSLVFSTYLGGSEIDLANGIALDATGGIYVVGDTSSNDFPVTPGAYQTTPGGGQHDVFVAKLQPGGGALEYATFVGGNGADRSTDIAVDSFGNAYVTGTTNSTSFPTVNALQPVFRGGQGDVFLSMLNGSGSGLVYSTYLGGIGRDSALGLEVAGNGTVSLAGLTGSADFPVTVDAPAGHYLGGETDAFVTQVSPGGGQLLFSTFLGGSGADLALGIASGSGGDLFLCGATNSLGIGGGVYSGGMVDAFVMRLGAPAPAAPSGLQLSVVSGWQIDLAWQDNSTDEDSFVIERRTTGGAFGIVAVVGADVQSYSDTGLAPLTPYTYRVRAAAGGSMSSPSNEASATTPEGPAAPGNLTATAVSTTRIDLAWEDRSTDESGFVIERSTNGGLSFSPRDTVGPNVETYADLGLTPGTNYTYRVRAAVPGGFSPASNQASATTFQSAPAAPTNLFAVATGSSTVELFWEDGSFNEAGFRIERATGVSAFSEIHVTGPNVVSYTDTGLAPGTQYRYRVRATNGGGDSDYSNIATATTAAGTPAVPTDLAVSTVSSSALEVTWSHPGGGVTSFRIERALVGGAFAVAANVGAEVRSWTDTGLQASTTYRYRIQARGPGGDSPFTGEVSGKTAGTPPQPPSGLIAEAIGRTEIVLTWQDESAEETGFRIERRPAGGVFAVVAAVAAGTVQYADTGLGAETEYSYRVRAFNGDGESDYSNTATAVTWLNPPLAPAVEALSHSQLRLTWQDGSAVETSTRIERSTDGVTFVEIATTGPDAVSFTDSGLLAATTYHYRLRYSAGEMRSDYTSPVSGATLPAPPGAPHSLAVSAEEQQKLRLVWAGSTNEAEFVVERWQEDHFAAIGTTAAGVVTYTDTGLAPETVYRYRVKARNAGGESAYSNEAAGTTLPAPPAAPSGLAAAAEGPGAVRLTWTDNAVNETAFEIERRVDGADFALLVSVGADTTSYLDTGLFPATTYTYRVRAVNAGGASSYTNSVSATTLVTPPPAPTGLTAIILSDTSIRLSWTDTSGGTAQFRVLREAPGGAAAVIGTVPVNTTEYVDSTAASDTTYNYSVTAFNAGGESSSSDLVTVTIPSGGKLNVPKRAKFGKRRVGKVRVRTIRIRNRGKGELAGFVDAGSVTGPFRVLEGAGSFTLPRKGKRLVRVEFAPTEPGSFRTSLVITSTDPKRSRVEVTLIGKGK